LIELASYVFEPPSGATHAQVLLGAYRILDARDARGDRAIAGVRVADAIEALLERTQDSLSNDGGPENPYRR
jgi:glyoxalase family protein